MAFVDYYHSVDQIIDRAALMMNEKRVRTREDPDRRLQYYDALNDFLLAMSRMRPWWFLRRHEHFVTKRYVTEYTMRTQSKFTVTIAAIADGDIITIDAREYEFDDDGSYTGNVQVPISSTVTPEEAIDAFVMALNSDADRGAMAVKTSATTCDVFLAGNASVGTFAGYTGTGSVAISNPLVTQGTASAASMPDFLSLASAPSWVDNHGLMRMDQVDVETRWHDADIGQPYYYNCDDVLRVYSDTLGSMDGIYLIQIGYHARMSAVLPDGQGRLDVPAEYRDILPRAIQLILKTDSMDPEMALADHTVQRRLQELESHGSDMSPMCKMTSGGDGLPVIREVIYSDG